MYGDLKRPRKAFLEVAVCTRFQREKGQREQQMKRPQDREEQREFQDTANGLCGWTLGTGWESGLRQDWAPAKGPPVRSVSHIRDFDLRPQSSESH